MKRESRVKTLVAATRNLPFGARLSVVGMLVVLTILFVVEIAEVSYLFSLMPFPKWTIVLFHFLLLVVLVHYLVVYVLERSHREHLSRLNEQLHSQVDALHESEEELRDTTERLRAFGNALPDIAFILDKQGRYREILTQPQKESLLYAEVAALKGRLLHDVLPKKDADLFLAVIRKTIETQENQILEYRLGVQAGERWFEGRTAPLSISGQDTTVVWVSRDITERKEAEEKVRRSEASLAEAQRIAHLGNWDWDIAGGALAWSDEIYRIFGLPTRQFAATYEAFLDRVHPDDREYVREAVEQALSGKAPYSIDHRIVLPDGTVRFVHEQAEVSFGDQGKPGRMIGTVQDITERKRIEELLEKHNSILEEKVRERTEELEEKTILAEAARQAKSDFLSNMTHELRTPLNSIIGFSEILGSAAAGVLAEDQKGYIRDIWESGKHLSRIVDDILAMTEIDSGTVELELSEFPLKETLVEALGSFAGKAAKQRIKIGLDIPEDIGRVIADKAKIRRVIRHLVGNALKFTPDGGSIAVQARSGIGGQVPQGIEISVTDTGIGIAKEDFERLFHPFQQLSPTLTKKYEGVGVGLSICRSYVELHGGRIWAESELGKGSRFAFTLPSPAGRGVG